MNHHLRVGRGLGLLVILGLICGGRSIEAAGMLNSAGFWPGKTSEERMNEATEEARHYKAPDAITNKTLTQIDSSSYRACFVKRPRSTFYVTASIEQALEVAILNLLQAHNVPSRLVRQERRTYVGVYVLSNYTGIHRLSKYESGLEWAARGLAYCDSLNVVYSGLCAKRDTVSILGLRNCRALKYYPDVRELRFVLNFGLHGDLHPDPGAPARSTLPCGRVSSTCFPVDSHDSDRYAPSQVGWLVVGMACVEPDVVMRWELLNITGAWALGQSSGDIQESDLYRDKEKYSKSDPQIGMNFDLKCVVTYRLDSMESSRELIAEVAAGGSPRSGITPPRLRVGLEVIQVVLRPSDETPVELNHW